MTDLTDPLSNPLVSTDQSDYSPGSTATITASGFSAGDDIEFQITVIDPVTGAILWTGSTWDAYADASGSLLTSFYVSGAYANTTIQLTATDLTTGLAVNDLFTDAGNASFEAAPKFDTATLNPFDMTAANEHAPDPDVTVTGAYGPDFNSNGQAIFTAPGPDVPTGSGVIHSFVRLDQGSGKDATEQGYNTDERAGGSGVPNTLNDVHNEANTSPAFTHSVLTSSLQAVYADGHIADNSESGPTYYVFDLDINQDQHHPFLSLDEVQIWQLDIPDAHIFSPPMPQDTDNLTSSWGDAGANATLAYDLNPGGAEAYALLLNSGATAGSGKGFDLQMLVPTTDFDNQQYVYLYSAFGEQPDSNGNTYGNSASGYEEWSYLAKPSVTAPLQWDVSKTVVSVSPGDTDTIGNDNATAFDNVANNTSMPDYEGTNIAKPTSTSVVYADEAGQTITYTFTVHAESSNSIEIPLANVTVYDSLLGIDLPSVTTTNVAYLSDDPVPVVEHSDVTVSGDLKPGDFATWTYTYTVTQADIAYNGTQGDDLNPNYGDRGVSDYPGGSQGYIVNTATAIDTIDNLSDGRASTQTPVEQEPGWDVSKVITNVSTPGDQTSGSDPDTGTDYNNINNTTDTVATPHPETTATVNVADEAGQVITYQFTVHNSGTAFIPLADVEAKDSLLGDITTNGGTTSTYLPDHSSDGSHVYTYVGDDNNTYTTNITYAPSSNDGFLDPGGSVSWTYTYTVTQTDLNNNGSVTTTDNGSTWTATQTPGWSDESGSGTKGYVLNTATAHDASGNLSDGSASAASPVEYEPGMSVLKTLTSVVTNTAAPDYSASDLDNNTVVEHAGDILNYQVVITNTGNIDLTNLSVLDDLAQGSNVPLASLHVTNFSESGDSDNDNAASLQGGTLRVGEAWTFDVSYTVTQADLDNNGVGWSLTNHNLTSGSILGNPDPGNAENTVTVSSTQVGPISSTVDTPIEQEPGVNIEKLVSIDGGLNWYLPDDQDHTDANGHTIDDIAFLNSLGLGFDTQTNPTLAHPNLHAGTPPTVIAGATVTWEAVITNTGNVDLTHAALTQNVSDSIDHGTAPALGEDLGSLAVGHSMIDGPKSTSAVSGGATNTVTVTFDQGVSDSDTASYNAAAPGVPGLTAGYWAQHEFNWNGVTGDDKPDSNITSPPGDVLHALPTGGVVNIGGSAAFTGHYLGGSTGPGSLGIVLGDADASGAQNNGEVTLTLPLDAAELMVAGNTSTTSDARLILIQQAIASQLNVDHGDSDPGGLSANGGFDLLGTAVKWLTGSLHFNNSNTVPTGYNVDDGVGGSAYLNNHILESGNGSTYEFNTGTMAFDTTVKGKAGTSFVSTSSTDWNPTKAGVYTSDGYFVVDSSDSLLSGHAVVATGQDLKNALQAFNQAQLLTTHDGSLIYWATGDAAHDGLGNPQSNTQDGLWKVLVDNGIGHIV